MPFAGARIYKAATPVIGQAEPDLPLYRQLLAESDIKIPVPRRRSHVGDVPNAAFTAITFGALDYQDGGTWFDPAKPDRLTVPPGLTGKLTVTASWHSGAGVKAGGFIYGWLTRSDVESVDMKNLGFTQGQDNTLGPLVWTGPVVPGDFFKVVLLHALGKPIPEGALKFGTWLCAVFHGEPAPTPPGPAPGPDPNPTPNPVP